MGTSTTGAARRRIGAVLRPLAAFAAVAAAVPVATFALRTMSAAWLVAPLTYLNEPSPTRDLPLIERAGALAPGEAAYPHYEAHLHRQRMRAGWFDQRAAEHGRRAAAAAARAIRLVGTNPYFHLMAGGIALERAQLPATPPAERAALVARGFAALQRAGELNPGSPLLKHATGLEMLKAWSLLDEDRKQTAVSLLGDAAEMGSGYLAPALAALWNTPTGSNELLTLARQLTPATRESRLALASFLEGHAASIPGPAAEPIRREAVLAYAEAFELYDFDLGVLDRWLAAHRRWPGVADDLLLRSIGRLIESYESRPEVWLAAAAAYQLAGTKEARAAALERALAASGDAVEVRVRGLRMRGELRGESGDLAGSLDDLRAAARLAPGDAPLQIDLAQLLDRMGRDDEALDSYRKAVLLDPQSIRAREMLAAASFVRLEFLDAIEQWRAIVRRDNAAIGPRLRIARAYVAMGLADQAARSYAEILELQPENAMARQELAELSLPSRSRRP